VKAAAYILIALWGILLAEPLLANFNVKSPYSECSKPKPKKSSCSKKSTCSKEDNKEDKNDCEKNRCNPLLCCPTGNFYLVGQQLLHIIPPSISKKKAILINDNRILKSLSECWHPPEVI
jgi:hypothetical protein